ncbi:GAF domain-containing sensor histidine kinase [Paenibacillus sp. N4]|uniref:GAF domain-containing sensor histidine kinase n=1 Tax=Paenibacillus vietnamensis TaxID=2590547 RepID=UPI001CD0E386|nr:GAF domain-containing sensor histidine kinase [Paenibacillus vietnamensis]MCA0754772.1 GAF domain-containing sensor histidine kinase [Paenibacillus vietnamensis]
MYRDKRGNELAALKEIAEMLNSTNDMEQMLHDVLVKLLEVTGFSTGWIFMMDDSGENLCRAAYRLPAALNARNREVMCGTECWCMESFKQNKLRGAVNIIECSRISYAASRKLGDTEGISHHATVPLSAGKDRFGLLNVAEAGRERFSDEELALLQAVAYQIGTAIKRIRLYQAQELNANLYAKLGDVIQHIHAIQEVHELPLLAVKCIGDTFEWQHVSLFFYEQEQLSLRAQYTDGNVTAEWRMLAVDQAGPVSTAFRENRVVLIDDNSKLPCSSLSSIGIPSFFSAAAIPLRIRNCTAGVLLISSRSCRQFADYQQDFLYSLGDHITLCIENLRLYEQQRELARMEERNRLARDLHDSVIQKVFSLSFLAKGAETVIAGKDAVVERSLQEMRQMAQEALKEMRTLIWQLHPAGLEHGLLTALKQYGQSMGLIVHEQAEGVRELPRQVEEALWRIGQEALNNVKKHAESNRVSIHLVKSKRQVSLEIADNGKGFSPETLKGRLTMGLLSMRERAEMLGGELSIRSGAEMQTSVKAVIPITDGQPQRDKE